MDKAKIEERVRAQVQAEVAAEAQREADAKVWSDRYARIRKAGDAAEAPFLPVIAKAEAKAKAVWSVEQYDCEGRSSSPWATFANEADAIAARNGSNYYTEPRKVLVWASRKDFAAWAEASGDAAQARHAAEYRAERDTE